ncbi:TetR/AcrR family transcriptional regulator [Dyadobacter sp. 32]|uniref:TetR/AcrR family transcriptional regulator n=1 Tax=Dyadobacter sp. 32 TaxID=538966 RepID=UPI0039C621B4
MNLLKVSKVSLLKYYHLRVRDRIIKEAFNLFWRYGIKSVTMDEIARELGISKRTIYQHFPDKNAIVSEVIQNELNTQTCQFDEIEEAASNPVDQIIQLSAQMRVMLSTINPTLFFDLKKYHPDGWQLFTDYKNQYLLQNVRDNLNAGIGLGLYRDDLDIEVLARLRIEQIEMAFDPTLFPFGQFDMIHVQIQFINHFLRGILTPKGFNYYNNLEKTAIESNTHEK